MSSITSWRPPIRTWKLDISQNDDPSSKSSDSSHLSVGSLPSLDPPVNQAVIAGVSFLVTSIQPLTKSYRRLLIQRQQSVVIKGVHCRNSLLQLTSPNCHVLVCNSASYYKEIKPANPKGNQPWIFIKRTNVEAKAPILWPPDLKSQLIGKDPDVEKDWRQEEKRMSEDEMVGWHHRLDGHEFDQAPGDSEGRGSQVCCSPWGRRVRHDWETEQQKSLLIFWCYYSASVCLGSSPFYTSRLLSLKAGSQQLSVGYCEGVSIYILAPL